jgi:hypothetical protein
MKTILTVCVLVLVAGTAMAQNSDRCFPPGAPADGQLMPNAKVTVAVRPGRCPSGKLRITGGHRSTNGQVIRPRTCECVN